MIRVTIRFYEELNDFIPPNQRKKDLSTTYYGKRAIKDLIESYSIPHVEVDLILVNGESVGFDYLVEDGDRISVYPMFERLNISGLSKLREHPLRESRFILDVHLGKLAKYLRILGFDVMYNNHMDDPELAQISSDTKRILLTRDIGLLKRKIVERGLIIRHNNPYEQCVEVLDRLDLWDKVNPFTRCMVCNKKIKIIKTNTPEYHLIENIVPPNVKKWCSEYHYCPTCNKAYWKGSHWDTMKSFLDRLNVDHSKKIHLKP